MTTQSADPSIDEYADTARYQRPWYWYDWANSAFVTTTATVLFGPYLTAIATEAACPGLPDGADCTTDLNVLGLPIDPGSLHPYTVGFSTFVGALLLIFVGAIADRTKRPARLMALFAGIGATAASLMFFVEGTNWQLGVVLLMVASIALGASLVVYDAILVRIAHPDDRDKVSSRGWALGYLGGGLLLAVNFLMLSGAEDDEVGQTVRLSMLMAGLWWGLFTLIPVIGMWQMRGVEKPVVAAKAGVVGGTLRQLSDTFRHLLGLRQTLLFLVAYMFFNDGIQTVIGQSSLYGTAELGFSETTMLTLFLMVQFVAFGGALVFGRIARRLGAWRTVLGGIVMWVLVIVAAFFVPEKALAALFALGVGIGLVMGGTQALSRSMYSQLVPRDREAEFFSLYQALERGTSWFGAVIFGLVHQLTDSYRPAILALLVFFVLGGVLLSKVDMRRGIREAGNEVPAVL
ncbi:MFS transporter [Knoellia flava TL1]|uniref:MFS transporter n=2 Tax=Knoellia flava TaxID=913969 RepID=A0A8H9KR20_9MICO|nr:MFS transporter [Knoellia flava]KGN29820.1 MFS transporter [Knoellia flava TL1]GGB66311.1 MFS transporter [Knoellia flava]